MDYLTRDNILAASDITTEEVDVPEWGGTVLVRALSGAERDRFEQSLLNQGAPQKNGKRGGKTMQVSMENARAKLCALSVVDADGNRLFSDKDAAALGKKSGAALDRVFGVAQRLSGITDADIDEVVGKSAEEMVDNPFGDSSTP